MYCSIQGKELKALVLVCEGHQFIQQEKAQQYWVFLGIRKCNCLVKIVLSADLVVSSSFTVPYNTHNFCSSPSGYVI
ncbi:hypothetical protein LWI28_024719 [Acer negundo]|uniref:Uncharacterized protein n=1 Tax=Acer negundo TaxID=4023 RepID=A0AAD5J2E9_ACENE|nr:hypothetical protein LWI28_024719 [Acer negundo]